MGHTLIEKIIMKGTDAADVRPGQIVTVKVDRVMIHDIFIPFVVDKFKEMGFTKVWDPDKVVLIMTIWFRLLPSRMSATSRLATPLSKNRD